MAGGGLSEPRLEHMRAMMRGFVERGELPGLVLVLERRGETVVEAFGGFEPDGQGPPLRRDALFRIASLSKPLLAAATLLLVEDGTLRLEDSVEGLLPELADRRVLTSPDAPLTETVPAERPILVRDLLTFTSGYGLPLAPPGTWPIQRALEERRLGQGPTAPSVPPAPDEWIRLLGELPLLHQPGSRWAYHTGADILGVLLARAGGLSLDKLLRERLFDPLGMVDTGFSVPPDQAHRLPPEYAADHSAGPGSGGLIRYDPGGAAGQWSRPPAFPSGGGGLVSTVDDYLAFARMLLRRGLHRGERLLSRPAVAAMTADQLTAEQKRATTPLVPGFFDQRGWGLGLSVVTGRGGPSASPGTFGWDGALGTRWYSDPAEDLTLMLFTQLAWSSAAPPPAFATFWNLAYAALDD